MKTMNEKEKFIELKALDYSYDKISTELNISKQTLLKWGSKYYNEISSMKKEKIKLILEIHNLTIQEKLECYSKKLTEVIREIEKIDVGSLPLKDLLLLKQFLKDEISNEKSKFPLLFF